MYLFLFYFIYCSEKAPNWETIAREAYGYKIKGKVGNWRAFYYSYPNKLLFLYQTNILNANIIYFDTVKQHMKYLIDHSKKFLDSFSPVKLPVLLIGGK